MFLFEGRGVYEEIGVYVIKFYGYMRLLSLFVDLGMWRGYKLLVIYSR